LGRLFTVIFECAKHAETCISDPEQHIGLVSLVAAASELLNSLLSATASADAFFTWAFENCGSFDSNQILLFSSALERMMRTETSAIVVMSIMARFTWLDGLSKSFVRGLLIRGLCYGF
jgi:hypothetical protein